MSQFYVYLNVNAATKKNIPYLLDVQTDLLSQMDSRVVVPLKRVKQASMLLQHLNPVFEIEGDLYVC